MALLIVSNIALNNVPIFLPILKLLLFIIIYNLPKQAYVYQGFVSIIFLFALSLVNCSESFLLCDFVISFMIVLKK